MRRIAKYLLKTAVDVCILSILMSFAWDSVFPGKIYYCTDEAGLGYIHPGSWVHGRIEIVDNVPSATSRSMGDPDVMRRGWTVERLWVVWSTMFGVSVVLALTHAKFRWFTKVAPSSKSMRQNRVPVTDR